MAGPMTDGVVQREAPKRFLKKSRKGFEWPEPRDASEEIRKNFSASFQELSKAKGETHVELARHLFGEFMPDKHGYKPLRGLGPIRDYIMTTRIPSRSTAEYIADYYHVSLERLLTPKEPYKGLPAIKRFKKKGKVQPPAATAESKRKYTKHRANGHFVLPEGEKKPVARIATHPKHDGWATLNLQASLPMPVALAVMGLVNPSPEEAPD